MVWYRVWTRTGGGHQGSHEEYIFEEDILLDEEVKESMWVDWVDRNHYTNAIGDVEMVSELPEPDHERLVSMYIARLENTARMLKELQRTPTKPCPHETIRKTKVWTDTSCRVCESAQGYEIRCKKCEVALTDRLTCISCYTKGVQDEGGNKDIWT